MRLSLGTLLILSIWVSSIGQDKDRAGYIGANIGTSYLLNGTSDAGKIGANLNVLNFGYIFKSRFGISFKWMGGAHIVTDDYQIGYGAIMAGPMYSFNLSENLLLDLKIQSGLFWTVEEIKFIAIDNMDPNLPNSAGKYSATSIKSLSTGFALRHNFAKRWNWMLLAEFNSGRSTGLFVKSDRINTISLNAGVGFRI